MLTLALFVELASIANMSYIHSVDMNAEQGPGLRHFRESTLSSGLVSVTEIGRTIVGAALAARVPDQLVKASGHEVAVYAPTGEFDILSDSTTAPDLNVFVPRGIEAWDVLCAKIGFTHARARLYEAGVFEPECDTTTASGLIVPNSNPELTFKRFIGTPDELVRLNQLEQRINIGATDPSAPVFGVYL